MLEVNGIVVLCDENCVSLPTAASGRTTPDEVQVTNSSCCASDCEEGDEIDLAVRVLGSALILFRPGSILYLTGFVCTMCVCSGKGEGYWHQEPRHWEGLAVLLRGDNRLKARSN